MTRRDALQRATKRAHAAARRLGKRITWKEARERGLAWCISMWFDFVSTKKAVRS